MDMFIGAAFQPADALMAHGGFFRASNIYRKRPHEQRSS
jgi:hypothetical protein